MVCEKKMGPDAAATAIRTRVVPFEKQTVTLCLKGQGNTSTFAHAGGDK